PGGVIPGSGVRGMLLVWGMARLGLLDGRLMRSDPAGTMSGRPSGASTCRPPRPVTVPSALMVHPYGTVTASPLASSATCPSGPTTTEAGGAVWTGCTADPGGT